MVNRISILPPNLSSETKNQEAIMRLGGI